MGFPSTGYENMNVPGMTNCWGMPSVNSMNTGMPGFGMGTAYGMNQPFDFGLGRSGGSSGGGFFRGLVKAVTGTIKALLPIAVNAGIGFLMGGPVGAAMGAAGSLLGGDGMNLLNNVVGASNGGQGMSQTQGYNPALMNMFSTLFSGAPSGDCGALIGASL